MHKANAKARQTDRQIWLIGSGGMALRRYSTITRGRFGSVAGIPTAQEGFERAPRRLGHRNGRRRSRKPAESRRFLGNCCSHPPRANSTSASAKAIAIRASRSSFCAGQGVLFLTQGESRIPACVPTHTCTCEIAVWGGGYTLPCAHASHELEPT